MTPLLALIALLAAGCVGSAPTADLASTARVGGAAPSDCLSAHAGLDLQTATIADLQQALASGRTTSVALVEAYVARIAAFDEAGPRVNSVQEVSATALAQAAARDAERAAGHVRGPLHGIPLLLKDNIGTDDQATTAGSIALAGNVPPEDATLTARLREAGAIVLGKTKLSEFANWVSLTMPNGYSSLGGQVVNAYTGGDPSGSSSGSGVAGSMAFAAGTLGTETSGSILAPSHANSLVGHKPTTGLVSRAGVIPLAGNFDTPGPMTRNVHDAAAILSAIAGPDPRDPLTAASEGKLPPARDYTALLRPDALQGVRLGYDPSFDDARFVQARADLAAAGATLVPVRARPELDLAGYIELVVIPNEFKAGLNRYLAEEAGPGLPVGTLTDVILFNQQHPDKVKYGQDLLLASDAQPGSFAAGDAAARPIVLANAAFADALLGQADLDALVGPGLAYTAIGAAAGYPTVIVPAGYDGVRPEGLSFFGPAWSDGDLLAYAHAYERVAQRRVPPTTVNATLLEGVCTPAGPEATAASAPGARGTWRVDLVAR